MLGNLLHQLLTCREDFEILRSRPDLIPAAVEESLRVTPPVLYVVRNCERDTEIGGVLIREGERVIVSIASANRDHEVFPDADEFKLDREDPLPPRVAASRRLRSLVPSVCTAREEPSSDALA